MKAKPARLKAECRKATARLALDVAAQELGIGTDSVGFSDKNPAIQRKAREVRNDSQFKEVMARILGDKNDGQVRKITDNKNSTDRLYIYSRSLWEMEYEKQCSELAAEKMLTVSGGAAPSKEKIEAAAKQLRKEETFKAFCREKLGGKDLDEVREKTRELSKEQVKKQTVEDICGRFAAPPNLDPPRVPVKEEKDAQIGENGGIPQAVS